jgi:Domain of unknown function(DUF2779)
VRVLSKSKILALRQCPKRLWLEIHRPELRQDSASTQASFNTGNQVGVIARHIYDPDNRGALIDPQAEGFDAAFQRTQNLLQSELPVFEAGFRIDGALAFADVLLPVQTDGGTAWRMVEVKSSTSLKGYHRDDVAVQAHIACQAGLPLASVSLAHIDRDWTYKGDNDYRGLLVEADLTPEALGRSDEVRTWLADAQAVACQTAEPNIKTGAHCREPFECGFLNHCRSQEPQAEQPLTWLPRVQSKSLRHFMEKTPACEIKDVPDKLLNVLQMRVKAATLSGEIYFDQAGAARALQPYKLPGFFIDFETTQFAVPIWKGTRPYQQLCFQFSVHSLSESGELTHAEFLDLTGNDPSEPFARALIQACGSVGPVFVYNAGFEKTRIKELAQRFPHLADPLLAINARVVDLWPIAQNHYYHPSQQGSWSIKAVLPAACPQLKYSDLEGVKDGGMAMAAYAEAIQSATTPERREQIRTQLLAYCKLDTLAMVRLWEVFAGTGR